MPARERGPPAESVLPCTKAPNLSDATRTTLNCVVFPEGNTMGGQPGAFLR